MVGGVPMKACCARPPKGWAAGAAPPLVPYVQASLPPAIGSTGAAAVAADAEAGPLEWNSVCNSSILEVTARELEVVSL